VEREEGGGARTGRRKLTERGRWNPEGREKKGKGGVMVVVVLLRLGTWW
jgi:hypothetical protein